MDWITILDWTGSALGLSGAALLASQTRVSRYGFVAFLLANFATGALAWAIHRHGLFCQQLGFTATSILGLIRTGFIPVPPRLAETSRNAWARVSTSAARVARRLRGSPTVA